MRYKKASFLLYIVFILFYTFLFLHNVDLKREAASVNLFLFDKDSQYRLDDSIRSDYDTNTIFITRLFHNKSLVYTETFFISIFRSLDLAFLFSLSDSSLYANSGKIKMLYPVEFPLFLIAVVYLLKREALHKKYFYLLPTFFLSMFVVGLFLPMPNVITLTPLVVVLRTVYFVGIYELVKEKRWSKR